MSFKFFKAVGKGKARTNAVFIGELVKGVEKLGATQGREGGTSDLVD